MDIGLTVSTLIEWGILAFLGLHLLRAIIRFLKS